MSRLTTTTAMIGSDAPAAVHPVTGDRLWEVVVVGPTGDYSWGFMVDEDLARGEVNRLNDMFQVTNADIEAMNRRDAEKKRQRRS